MLAQQIVGKQVIDKKVPTWIDATGLVFPPKIHLEQSSSEATAKYKASITKGQSFIDLTGGIGVDSFFLAKSFARGIHCELNEELQYVANHNFRQLQSPITSFAIDGIDYLENTKDTFDLIYLDPPEEITTIKKSFDLKTMSPMYWTN